MIVGICKSNTYCTHCQIRRDQQMVYDDEKTHQSVIIPEYVEVRTFAVT